MSAIPSSIPRATDPASFFDSPIEFLTGVHSTLGNLAVIRDGAAIFSRTPDCAGVIAVFGAEYHRAVLNDMDTFGLPVSAGQRLSLPDPLLNLNRSLHSMRGRQHHQHQRLLAGVLSDNPGSRELAVKDGLRAFTHDWRTNQTIELLTAMRGLALEIATRLLLGTEYQENPSLGLALMKYFQTRREATSPGKSGVETLREQLIVQGTALDSSLRRYIRWLREGHSPSSGIIPDLANRRLPSGDLLSEDELVAHSNILFVSSTEPIAVSLTWILLILSQLPELRRALRTESDPAPPSDTMRTSVAGLLEGTIKESLRLLPPNLLMARITTRPAPLGEFDLPEGCEILLCPFVAHRDESCFPRPFDFLPNRWAEARPSPFEYFPFGGGGHYCVGQQLALSILRTALTWLGQSYDLVLARDQPVDWRLHIMLMPRNKVTVRIHALGPTPAVGGKLTGPVAALMNLTGDMV